MRLRIRSTVLLLSTALLAGGLSGCALLVAELRGCDGTEERVKELDALSVLDDRPDGATRAAPFGEPDAGCWADSGDVVVYANRTYTFSGDRAEVFPYYREVARREGWTESAVPWHTEPGRPEDLYFTREDGAVTLLVSFLTPESFAHAEERPGPEFFSSGSPYEVSVESFLD
ncbi:MULTISPECIES: hypothetical protein [unclassified Streptomyces]|uniref:hypothetical protein n=1 Tax=unclassified Streptomyces TaxID=2593676 RepID=UPI0035DB1F14